MEYDEKDGKGETYADAGLPLLHVPREELLISLAEKTAFIYSYLNNPRVRLSQRLFKTFSAAVYSGIFIR